MLLNRRCTRCGGNLFIGFDNGWQTECLQCSEIKKIDDTEISPIMKGQLPRYDMSYQNTSSPTFCKLNNTVLPSYSKYVQGRLGIKTQ